MSQANPVQKIPFVNFAPQTQPLRAALLEAAGRVLDSGQYILGPEVSAFEKEFAEYSGSKHAIGVSNGTTALYYALKALGIGEGEPDQEVITVSNTFISTITSIAMVGAKPVFIDIAQDLTMDPNKIEDAITPRTRAIMPVHLTGRISKMPQIMEIAKRHNLPVIEDAAQAVGASIQGKRSGAWGTIGCFSLHPLKNLHAFGDAGIMTTDDDALAAKIRLYRNIGLVGRNEVDVFSPNGRLDELHAAMLRVNLRHLDEWNQEKRRIVAVYNEGLRPFVKVPEDREGQVSVTQVYTARAQRRDELLAHLIARGVDAKIHYPSLVHDQPIVAKLQPKVGPLPETVTALREVVSLPCFIGITRAQQEYVIEQVRKFYEN